MMMRPLGWFSLVLIYVSPLSAQEVAKPAPPPVVAVVPLPERPSEKLVEVMAAVTPYKDINSWLVDAQVTLWLQHLSIPQLEAELALIPSPWKHDPYFSALSLKLDERIKAALAAHPSRAIAYDHPQTALEAGRRAGAQDWQAALAAAEKIADREIRDQFLLGMLQATGRSDTLAEGRALWKTLVPLLQKETQKRMENYADRLWMGHWPAAALAKWIDTTPEKSETMGYNAYEEPDGLFANEQEARKFFDTRLSWERIFHSLNDRLNRLEAVRDPEGFLDRYEAVPHQSDSLLVENLTPLLQRNPALIERVIRNVKKPSSWETEQIAKAWLPIDPAAALAWLIKQPEFKQVRLSSFQYTRAKPLPIAKAVDLVNQYPILMETQLYLYRCFDPRRDEPAASARALLRLKEAKFRLIWLPAFGRMWAPQDGAAALAFAKEIAEKEVRQAWVKAVAEAWLRNDPEPARAALKAVPEISAKEIQEIEARLAYSRTETARFSLPEVVQFPALVGRPIPALPAGGKTDAATIEAARRTLTELAFPGAPAIANAELCAEVLKLSDDTVTALLGDLDKQPPQNAKENVLRRLLIERWALSAPEAAARWIVAKGNGQAREALPLALTGLVLKDTALAFELARQLPDENRFHYAQMAMISALARRSHREACEAAERYGLSYEEIGRDWMRVEPEAAKAWLKVRWADRY